MARRHHPRCRPGINFILGYGECSTSTRTIPNADIVHDTASRYRHSQQDADCEGRYPCHNPFADTTVKMAQRMHLRLSPEVMAKFEDYSPVERIRAVLAIKAPNDQRFSSKFIEEQCQLREVKVLSDKSAVVTFAFKVDVFYCNGSGNLHGGAQVGNCA